MTPNNIVNMAMLKKLDAISVTDHNSCDNVESILRVADSKLIVVPGMEVQTRRKYISLLFYRYRQAVGFWRADKEQAARHN